MRQRLEKMRYCFLQLACSCRFIARRHARSHTRAASPVGRKQAFLLKFGIRARHRVGCDAEITGQLPYRRQTLACAQFTAIDEAAELFQNLLERREIGIDREEKLFHNT